MSDDYTKAFAKGYVKGRREGEAGRDAVELTANLAGYEEGCAFMRRQLAAALYWEAGVMREERRWRLEYKAPGADFYYDRTFALADAARKIAP